MLPYGSSLVLGMNFYPGAKGCNNLPIQEGKYIKKLKENQVIVRFYW